MNDKRLYIVGAGGFAREIYSYLNETDFEYNGYELAGFLSDYDDDLVGFNFKHGIKGSIKTTQLNPTDVLIMGIADCVFKEEVFNFYRSQGMKFISYIHLSAFVGIGVEIGEGSVLCPYSTLTTNIKIGECTTINAHSSIGHDASIGSFCTLSGHCDITGGVNVGDRVMFGSHALVIPGKVVESDSIVGSGSVVIKKVKSGTTVFGNPASKIK